MVTSYNERWYAFWSLGAVEDDKDPGDGSDNGDDGEDQEEEEADDDMQLAWENLEVAKTIYERDSASHKTRLTGIIPTPAVEIYSMSHII